MKVRDFCSTKVVTTAPTASLREVSLLMRNAHVGAVVVVERDAPGVPRPVGIVTDRDIVVAVLAQGARPENIRACDVMPPELATIRSSDGLFEASRMMAGYGVRRLPVVTEEGSLFGIVTSEDVLRVLCAELGNLASAQSRAAKHEAIERRRLGSA